MNPPPALLSVKYLFTTSPFLYIFAYSEPVKYSFIPQTYRSNMSLVAAIIFLTLMSQVMLRLNFFSLAKCFYLKELSTYHQDLVLHDLGIATQITVNPLSPELCQCVSKLILTDPLLASILVKLMCGKTDVHQTNNLELQQLFCKQVSSLLSQLLQQTNGNRFRETFDNLTSILAISQPYLSSNDELFVETCKHFYKKLLSMENKKYAEEFVISFFGETGDTSLLQMLQEYETDIRLESLNIGYSHTSYNLVETGKYIASKLEGGSAEQWMNMFLLCYKHNVHLLQCIVVSLWTLKFCFNFLGT